MKVLLAMIVLMSLVGLAFYIATRPRKELKKFIKQFDFVRDFNKLLDVL